MKCHVRCYFICLELPQNVSAADNGQRAAENGPAAENEQRAAENDRHDLLLNIISVKVFLILLLSLQTLSVEQIEKSTFSCRKEVVPLEKG